VAIASLLCCLRRQRTVVGLTLPHRSCGCGESTRKTDLKACWLNGQVTAHFREDVSVVVPMPYRSS
jgi:hypothetical protein